MGTKKKENGSSPLVASASGSSKGCLVMQITLKQSSRGTRLGNANHTPESTTVFFEVEWPS
jgi:hypothetical protein